MHQSPLTAQVCLEKRGATLGQVAQVIWEVVCRRI